MPLGWCIFMVVCVSVIRIENLIKQLTVINCLFCSSKYLFCCNTLILHLAKIWKIKFLSMLTILSTRLRKANTKNFLNFRKSKNMSDRFWEHWRGTVTANPSICRVFWQTWQRFINVLSWLLFDGPVYFTVAGFFLGCYKLPAFPEPVYPNSGKKKRGRPFLALGPIFTFPFLGPTGGSTGILELQGSLRQWVFSSS